MDYLEDIPEIEPIFDFDQITHALIPLLIYPGKGAIVVGIHGDWGAGKTTLMDRLAKTVESREQLRQLSDDKADEAISVRFNAWKFQDREALWRALILQVIGALRERAEREQWAEELGSLRELEESLYHAFEITETGPWKINWRNLITELLRLALAVVHLDVVADAIRESTGWLGRLFISKTKDGGDKNGKEKSGDNLKEITGILERTAVQRHVAEVRSVEQFLSKFQDLVSTLLRRRFRVFVFVDDLDRCLPEAALQVFESIKLFLDAPGCGYVVALDREVIRKGLAARYSQAGMAGAGQDFIDPDEYIEKTISLSFDLPPLTPADRIGMIKAVPLPRALTSDQLALLARALGSNPRRIKRFMNLLAMNLRLAAIARASRLEARPVPTWLLPGDATLTDDDQGKFTWYLKALVLSYRYPGASVAMLRDVALLKRLHDVAGDYRRDRGTKPLEARAELRRKCANELPVIKALGDTEDFWRLLSVGPKLQSNPSRFKEVVGWFRAAPVLDQAAAGRAANEDDWDWQD
jgi:hypothetical protein